MKPSALSRCCAVIELRRYTLHPGQRETLIALFDREFVESQEATGMRLIGQFRDIDRPDVFTWLRGFPDMAARAGALAAFYDGPVWAAHRDAANRTMIDSDDVRLLRPARRGSDFVLGERPAPGEQAPSGMVLATIYTLTPGGAEEFADFFERVMAPPLAANGARPVAALETEPAANNFPRLPVREGERAFVWFARFADIDACDASLAALRRDPSWSSAIEPRLGQYLAADAEVWRLTPTARSRDLR